jgi:hypothetical protein
VYLLERAVYPLSFNCLVYVMLISVTVPKQKQVATFQQTTLALHAAFTPLSRLAYSGETCSWETSVGFQQTTRHYIPEDRLFITTAARASHPIYLLQCLLLGSSMLKTEAAYSIDRSTNIYRTTRKHIVKSNQISRPVCLGVRHPFRTRDQLLFLS